MKVLQIIDGSSFGGIAKLMLDISNTIKDVDMDFLTATNIYDDWYNLGIDRKTIIGKIIYTHRLSKFLKENKYDIVHINSAVFLFSFQVVIISRLRGIKKVIVHSHNSKKVSLLRRIIKKVLNPLYRRITDVHLTCSKEASLSLFTKQDDVILLKNGIDVNEFKYNEKIRKEYRKKFNINEKLVYGHVGRFDKQKNHDFLIDLFYELQKKKDSVLLLVGTGQLEKDIKNKVKKLKLEDKVLFLGFRNDISKLLNAMDIFLFPSLYEGLGISVIEAQTSGLTTIVSDAIPEEANISKRFIKVDSFNLDKWVDIVSRIKIDERINSYKDTIKNGYDIKETANKLEIIYKDLMSGD